MKKYNLLLSLFASLILLNGCFDLDRFPTDKPSEETYWKTEEHAQSGMMGVYNAMKNHNVFGVAFGLDCLGDVGAGYDNAAYDVIAKGTYTSRTRLVRDKYQSLYDGVARTNVLLQNVNKIDMKEELKQQYIGEVKFMRALFYFTLLDFFGGVPLYDETTIIEKEFNTMLKPRSSEEETRAFILKDLNDALASPLPEEWSQPGARATKGAARALRGKVYLYAKQYKEALADFNEVVNSNRYALYPSYENLFKLGGDESSEMIFAIQNLGGVGIDFGMPMTFYIGSRSSFGSCWNNVMAASSFVDSYEWKDGKPFNWDEVIPGFSADAAKKQSTFLATLTSDAKRVDKYPEAKETLLEMYGKRDPRMASSIILPYTQYKGWNANAPQDCEYVVAVGAHESNGMIRVNAAMKDMYLWRKFVAEYNMNGKINNRAHTPINFPLIRYADVLLMLAECYNEVGETTKAVELINQVRARAEMPGINSGPEWLAANSKEEVFKRIRHERAVELALEGHNFSDLRRWGLLSELDKKDEFGFSGKRYYTRAVTSRDYLWPIPEEELEINKEMKQNPGW